MGSITSSAMSVISYDPDASYDEKEIEKSS
jgi:hypothetical protein